MTITFTLNSDGDGNSIVSDTLHKRIALREITDIIDSNGHRLYKVNGKPILIRGAGWTPDLFLRTNATRQEAEISYVKHMNLNTIRSEGKFETEHWFDLCDEQGILVMIGWCCCDSWQRWDDWKQEQFFVAKESLRSQVRRLRYHPSVFVFLVGSDQAPTPDAEKAMISVFNAESWPNPILSSASAAKSKVTGPSGVKMSGPYSYVAPSYWLVAPTTGGETELGGAHGFLTEGGPGENPMTQSIRRVLPDEHLWPIDDWWNYHCGSSQGLYGTLTRFTDPLNNRYGTTTSLHDFSLKSQAQAYEAHRAMFEAYTLKRYTATGLIQWMQNNPFPSHIWHLYDYFLVPGSVYFATRLACESVHPIYAYNDGSVWVSNSLFTDFIPKSSSLHLLVRAFSVDSSVLFNQDVQINGGIKADSSIKLTTVPQFTTPVNSTYFVRLDLFDGQDQITTNTYWLSTTPEVLDWDQSTWYNTPTKVYANYAALQSLPPSKLTSKTQTLPISATTMQTTVQIINDETGPIAFMVHVNIFKGESGINVAPIFWNNNFVTLLPGEAVLLQATYSTSDLEGTTPTIVVDSFN